MRTSVSLVTAFLLVAMLLFGGAAEASENARPGADTSAVAKALNRLRPGQTWDYVYLRRTPSFSSKFTVFYQGRERGRLVFSSVGSHRVDPATARRIDAAAKAGKVKILSKQGSIYQMALRIVQDSQGRLVERQYVNGQEVFAPHDCQQVAGPCRYTLTDSQNGKTLHLVRQSTFQNGVWKFQVNIDPSRDPEGRQTLMETGEISFGKDGVVLDSIRRRNNRHYSSLRMQ